MNPCAEHAIRFFASLLAYSIATSTLCAEQVLVVPQAIETQPGSNVAVLLLMTDNATPLFGYSVDVDLIPAADAVGSVTADADSTNFFDAANLIAACPEAICPGGATRDPFFSVIVPTDDGVFISTNTDDGSTVIATAGINDVLAEVFLNVSTDAFGEFELTLGAATVLSDGDGVAVPFDFVSSLIYVIPEPTTATMILVGFAGSRSRRSFRRRTD